MDKRVALVTGANRGIGLEVVRQLKQAGLTVILTSRNEQRGQSAVDKLAAEGLTVDYHVLDVDSAEGVRELHDWVIEHYGRLDVLVNNAAVLIDQGESILDVSMETVDQTFITNTIGPLMLCQAFVPDMKHQGYGRIVNVSSGMGALAEMGARSPAYRLSKAAMNAMTRVLASELQRYRNIKVNAMCPGWVRTEMGGPGAPRSVAKGAETVVWLATLPASGPTNGFFRDHNRIEW